MKYICIVEKCTEFLQFLLSTILPFFFFALIEYIDKTSKRYRQARNWNHQARNKLHFEEAHSVSLVKI